MVASPVLTDYPTARRNVFLMMRFSPTSQNEEIQSAVQQALSHYGLNLLRADQKVYVDSLWENVRAYMHGCELGIAVFDQIGDHDFNPNVSIELGYMLASGRKVLLLKDKDLALLPSDLVGYLYKPFDSHSVAGTVGDAVRKWLRDLGIAKTGGEKLLVYMSYGGTCRCAMAKVATRQALWARKLTSRLRVESIAYRFGDANEASPGARRAVMEAYGADLLEDHRVTPRNDGILADADLILVMDAAHKKALPPGKTFAFTEFFGESGDVPNPWPIDHDFERAAPVYRDCLAYMRSKIEGHIDQLLAAIGGS